MGLILQNILRIGVCCRDILKKYPLLRGGGAAEGHQANFFKMCWKQTPSLITSWDKAHPCFQNRAQVRLFKQPSFDQGWKLSPVTIFFLVYLNWSLRILLAPEHSGGDHLSHAEFEAACGGEHKPRRRAQHRSHWNSRTRKRKQWKSVSRYMDMYVNT